jgi:hypothetical protein
VSTSIAGEGFVEAIPPPDDPTPSHARLDELRQLVEQARQLREQAVAWRKGFREAVERLRQDLRAQRQARKERNRG